MALPLTPFSALPDFSKAIREAQGRANSLAQRAWATLSPEQPQAPVAAPQEAPGTLSQEMSAWVNQSPTSQQFFGGASRDDYSAMGLGEHVPRSLIGTESGGNFGAVNNVMGAGGAGHDGFLQFGQARRQEAVDAGVIPAMSREEFRANKQAQVAAANWHFNDIDNRIRKAGYDRLVGQSIGGAPMTWNGMRAMAHLGGFGGLSRFINSGGRYNPADAYGTSLLDYAIKHRG